MVAEGLNHLTKAAVTSNRFSGLSIGSENVRLTYLQYAGKRLFFEDTGSKAECIGFIAGALPISYLGLPIGSSMSNEKSWELVFDNFGKRLENLKARSLSYGGRLTLIKLGGSSDVSKMAWVKWDSCLLPYENGGLNIGSLAIKIEHYSVNVNLLTRLLSRAVSGNVNPVIRTIRNNLVPLKVELFIWRARLNCLPTKVELDKRGLDLGTIRCPVCDDDQETVENSIILCKTAKEFWMKVFDWWNIAPHPTLNLNASFLGNGHLFDSSFGRNLWQATEWVTGYLN
ncbi:uncharacterized protein [Rutidosis leptorrhynchoides]|uniref:uncharacterized protein n=1 Tax=Rutidosis leptorrhynchoides TaxID=125765 RepID=UPI003A9968FA